MAAVITKVPELEIDEKEGKMLSDSITRINELYNEIIIPEKTKAWIELMIAAGTIYGPRIVATSLRSKKEKKEQGVVIDAPTPGFKM